MRHGLLFTAVLCLVATPAFAQDPASTGAQNAPPAGTYSESPEYRISGEPASPQDAEAIQDLMRRFGQARGAHDAKGAAAAFSKDVEWTNAFGAVVRGISGRRTRLSQDESRIAIGPELPSYDGRRLPVYHKHSSAHVL